MARPANVSGVLGGHGQPVRKTAGASAGNGKLEVHAADALATKTIRAATRIMPVRAYLGAKLIEVIFPASTLNVASRCCDGAPGLTTSRSHS